MQFYIQSRAHLWEAVVKGFKVSPSGVSSPRTRRWGWGCREVGGGGALEPTAAAATNAQPAGPLFNKSVSAPQTWAEGICRSSVHERWESSKRKKVGEQSKSGRRWTGERRRTGLRWEAGERKRQRERELLLCKWTSKASDWFVLFSEPLISYNRATWALTLAVERQFSYTLLPPSKKVFRKLPFNMQSRLLGITGRWEIFFFF